MDGKPPIGHDLKFLVSITNTRMDLYTIKILSAHDLKTPGQFSFNGQRIGGNGK